MPLGLVGDRRQRAECDEDTVKIIGDGGHASVLYEMPYPEQGSVIIAVGDNASRKMAAERDSAIKYGTMIHQSAIISKSAAIGDGTVIMAGAIVQAGARIGKHVILNTACSVDHGCIVGDYAHIAPGAHLCGNVEIGEGTLVGVCVGIAPGCKIPAWSICKAAKLDIEPCPTK